MSFETVTTEAVLPGCVRKEKAWDIISDYSRYPAIMDNVDKVEITERTGKEGISRWYITVEEAPSTGSKRTVSTAATSKSRSSQSKATSTTSTAAGTSKTVPMTVSP